MLQNHYDDDDDAGDAGGYDDDSNHDTTTILAGPARKVQHYRRAYLKTGLIRASACVCT